MGLIVCAYCYFAPDAAGWPDAFWKALKPGGLVVFQSSVGTRRPVHDLAAHWKRFQLLRFFLFQQRRSPPDHLVTRDALERAVERCAKRKCALGWGAGVGGAGSDNGDSVAPRPC